MKRDIGSQGKAPRPKHVSFRMKSNTDTPPERKQYITVFQVLNQSHKRGPILSHNNPTLKRRPWDHVSTSNQANSYWTWCIQVVCIANSVIVCSYTQGFEDGYG